MSNPTPTLIYDGDCGFCAYWVRYWQRLTGDKVTYRSYQEVAADYPSLTIDDFKSAVQYVAPDGTISSAAKASFLTLSHAPGKNFWLSMYNRIPGFAFISEKTYTLISSHRSFFYTLSLLFWGREHIPSRYDAISWIFLRVFGLIFFAAFASFGVQALGLIGSQGIIPVSELTTAAYHQLGSLSYWILPMVFWFNSSDFAIQATCWGGALLSLFVVFNFLPRMSLLCLYILYLSLCCAGQLFMSFQWDMYLLETGLIAIFLLTYKTLGIWLLRWLLFRFMFAGGLVKWFSGDSTWRDFSALSYYFNTEPLPTPLAWYAHHLPQILLKTCTVATLIIEVFIPFLFFLPRRIRFIGAFFTLILQGLILITGNYNFFNMLTILLCLTLFDDAAISKIIPQRCIRFMSHSSHVCANKLMTFITWVFVIITIPLSIMQFYVRFGGKLPTPILWSIDSIAPLRIVNLYGPFAVMTTQRMEIIIEGSDDNMVWHEYGFKYKPGDVYRRPSWNIPHQPRLDWQMWFAALGTIDNNQWLLRVFERILQNSQPVISLLGENPFPDKPPVYLRALFYKYDFTDPDEKERTGAWWTRQLVGMYVPVVHLK